MNDQVFDMIKQRFDAVDRKLDDARDAFKAHSDDDKKYWSIIDQQQTQLSLIRRVFWGVISVLGTLGAWVGLKH